LQPCLLGSCECPGAGLLDAGPNDTRSGIVSAAVEVRQSRQSNGPPESFRLCFPFNLVVVVEILSSVSKSMRLTEIDALKARLKLVL
jgi:hypothetical protein